MSQFCNPRKFFSSKSENSMIIKLKFSLFLLRFRKRQHAIGLDTCLHHTHWCLIVLSQPPPPPPQNEKWIISGVLRVKQKQINKKLHNTNLTSCLLLHSINEYKSMKYVLCSCSSPSNLILFASCWAFFFRRQALETKQSINIFVQNKNESQITMTVTQNKAA